VVEADRGEDRSGSYRHLPDLQLPEQHWLFFVQVENLGLHEKQPLVLKRHVDVLQVRDPPAKPRLVQEAPSATPHSHCSVPATTPLPHAGVQSAGGVAVLSASSQMSSPQNPQSPRQLVGVSLPVQSESPQT